MKSSYLKELSEIDRLCKQTCDLGGHQRLYQKYKDELKYMVFKNPITLHSTICDLENPKELHKKNARIKKLYGEEWFSELDLLPWHSITLKRL